MTAVADARIEPVTDDALARRNAVILAGAQALAGGNSVVMISTASILGAMFAPDKALATVPISVYVVGLWLGTLPVGWLAKQYGRRTSFQVGTACGVLTGLICCLAVLQASFVLLNVGTFFSGLYAAAHQAYRFAAADTASDSFRPKAISWVLVGGVFAGVLGPQVVIATKDIWQPYLFAASFLAQAALALVSAAVLMLIRIPRLAAGAATPGGRPLREIARQPRFIVAVACGVASYAMMNMVMTSAPLAMIMCNHSVRDATLGIQWHVVGMFAPSFFTGSLIARFGVERVVAAGLILIIISALIGLAGITVAHFWIALTVLGIGWNFGFIGATAMVTQCHRPHERTTVQSLNDFLVFGSMAVGSFSSGTLLARFGWDAVNQVVFPVVLAAGALLLWLAWRERRRLV
jgi:predicted MFS family arabinose efflux permease